ncbi:MAG: hypothetical protein K2X11_13045 [Acetobacteraceae bacterium]|nr:hypothetical protein [Acetobacteraceae bacterium]
MIELRVPSVVLVLGTALVIALLLAAWQAAGREPHLMLRKAQGGDRGTGWDIQEIHRSAAKCGAQLRRVSRDGSEYRCLRIGDRVA